MCGLVGYITNYQNGLFQTDVNTFQQLLFFDVLRGNDATGISLINKDGEVEVYKECSSSPLFMSRDDVKTLFTRASNSGKALLGHNRKSTIGEDNDVNAHPFVIDNRYVFFHNGTIRDHKQLADTVVDSEALGIHLSKCEGDTEKLEEALTNVKGAYACVWYDQVKHTVYFLRNHERPLSIAEFEHGTGLAYASESWMLRGILNRNNQKVKQVFELITDTLYSIDLSQSPLSIKAETLVVKKHSSPATTRRAGGTWINTKQDTAITPSKQITKRHADSFKGYLNSGYKVTWMIDDYVEREVTGTKPLPDKETDYLCWGTSEEWPGVIFRGVFNNISLNKLLAVADNPIHAEICYNEYDKKLKALMVICRKLTSVEENETSITH